MSQQSDLGPGQIWAPATGWARSTLLTRSVDWVSSAAWAPSTVAYYAWLSFVAYSILKRVARLWTNPRRHIPGPWLNKCTSIPYEYYRLRGVSVDYVRSLHEKYGPVVLGSPDRTFVADAEAFAYISRMGSGFVKAKFYDRFQIGPAHVMFSMTDVKQHAARRKLFARAFTLDNLRKNWEAGIHQQVDRAVAQIKRDAESGVADVYKWWRLLAGDVIALLSFGESFGMVEGGKKTKYFNALVKAPLVTVIHDMIWPIPEGWLKYILPFKGIKELLDSPKVIYDQGTIAVENLRKTQSDDVPNFFRSVVAEADSEGKSELTDDAIRSEAALFMIAGSDTTAFSLTYLVWCVLNRPELQKRIEEEVAGLPENFTDKDVEALPLLNAALDETMRLYSAASGTTPRVVPKGGVTFCGYFVPEGSTVAYQQGTLGRMASVFDDPHTFDVTRWENITAQQKRVAQPFGLGPRNCIGQYLARIESRLAAATFFRELKGAKMSKTMTDEMMQIRVLFLGAPKGEKCNITLVENE